MPHKRMRTRILATLIVAVALGASAQTPPLPPAAPMPPAPQNVAQLGASASVEVRQDLLTIVLSTTREGADADAVQARLSAATAAALEEARKTAQSGQMDVRSGAFGLWPRHGKDGRIAGWQGTAEVVLEGRDFARISSAASRVPGLTVGRIGFGLSREERARVEAQAQAQAIERFRAKAGEVARAFGFADYSLRTVAVQADGGGMLRPPPMMAMQKMAGAADQAVPVEAGISTVTVTVTGEVQMR